MKVPFYNLKAACAPIREDIEAAIKQVIDSQCFILGPKLEEFESQYAALSGCKYCVGVGNGTDALTLALWAAGIGAGDEVIVPAFTFIATVHAITSIGATPKFVDIDTKTYCIDTDKVKEAITEPTKAVIAVNLFGQPCNYLELQELQTVKIIEDNAQGQGSIINGQPLGGFGYINTTSFYPTKNLGCFGDGGAITTNSYHVYQMLKQFRNQGTRSYGVYDMPGVNSRLDEIQAAVLLEKLKYLKAKNEHRNVLAKYYLNYLKDLPVQLPNINKDAAVNWHQFTILAQDRDKLKYYLLSKDIQTTIYWPIPCHLQKAYKSLGYKLGDFPNAESAANSCLSLPIVPELTCDEVGYVCDCIRQFYNG